MDASQYELIKRIVENRREVWFRISELNRWCVAAIDRKRDAGATIDTFDPLTLQRESRPKRLVDEAAVDSNWEAILSREPDATADFLVAFKAWRAYRKPVEDSLKEEQAATLRALQQVFQEIPAFSVPQRHQLKLQLWGIRYPGIRTPDETALVRDQRITHCWNCRHHLNNYDHPECLGCGWILCSCGACGCPRVLPSSLCPMCGEEFRHLTSRGCHPYCSWACKSTALDAYSDYLRSPEWQERRKVRLLADGYICQDCHSAATDVHHLTYKNIGRESMEDLVSLCHECHLRRHGPLDSSGVRWLSHFA